MNDTHGAFQEAHALGTDGPVRSRFILLKLYIIGFVLSTNASSLAIAQSIPLTHYLVVVASRPTLEEASAIAQPLSEKFPSTLVLRSSNGQFAVVLGLIPRSESKARLSAWIASGAIPADSFLSTGASYSSIAEHETTTPTDAGQKEFRAISNNDGTSSLKSNAGITYRVVTFDRFRRLSPDLLGAVSGVVVSGSMGLDPALPSGSRLAVPVRFISCGGFRGASNEFIKTSDEQRSSFLSEIRPDIMSLPDTILGLRRSSQFNLAVVERESKRCSDFVDSKPAGKWLQGARIFLFLLRAERVEAKSELERRLAPSGWANNFTIEGAIFSYSYDTYGRYMAGSVVGDLIPFASTGDIKDNRYLEAFR